MDFLQRTPFFRLLIPLVLGIIVFQYVELFSWSFFVLSGVSFLLLGLPTFLKNPNRQFQLRWMFGGGAFLLLFCLGYFISETNEQKNRFHHLNQPGIFSIELIESPIEKENSYLCRAETKMFSDSRQTVPTSGKAILYIQKDSASALLRSGDYLLVETTLQQPERAQNPNGFDYAEYLQRQGIGATAYIAGHNWKKTGENTSFSILRLAGECQKTLLEIYRRFGIEGDEFAVLAALTLGSKDALHPELRQNYTTSGGMHILAVSGLHVGIIYMVLSFLFSFIGRKSGTKLLKTILVLLCLWAYAFITGLPPSVMRASTMFSFIAIGASLERKPQIYNTISISAFLMLLIDPNYLFDVGFQLSYSAVLSIVYFQPIISKWFYLKSKPARWCWELTAVSLAAQIGTAPFSIYYFHQFPNYFLITNFVAIPFATFIIYGAVMLFVLSPVPYISVAVAFVLEWLLRILNFSIEWIHNLPFSTFVTSINRWQLLFAFVVVILLATYFQTKRFVPLFSALLLILCIFCINLMRSYQTQTSAGMVVFSDNKNTHISFIEGKEHYLFSTDSTTVERVAGNFWLHNKLYNPKHLLESELYQNGFVEFKGKLFCILSDDWLKNRTTSHPISVDYLIVGNGLKPKIQQIMECVHPQTIIVDKTISAWYAESIRKSCAELNIEYYSVAKQGAYILNFTH
jgi:competence protein ComEC